jgi:hypothetical protein
MMKRHTCLISTLLVVFIGCTSHPTLTHSAKQETPRRDDFDKKLKCAGLLDELQENAEHDQFKQESYVRTFYSPPLNACLAEKYTLYPHDENTPESMEIDDLSSNKTVWYSTVPCEIRDVGFGNPPRREYRCSDYYWNVQRQLDDYVTANHLENDQ